MNFPQVNANVTPRNRKQTERICELRGLEYPKGWQIQGGDTIYRRHDPPLKIQDTITGQVTTRFLTDICSAPNGSFTLDQVVGMLDDLKIVYFGGGRDYSSGWEPAESLDDEPMLQSDDPHDLTAAMDALIKVLEAKL